MGRYYTGDIEGKFWFAVQSSDDASFFGGSDEEVYYQDDNGEDYPEPSELEYFFQSGDLEEIEHGIEECLSELGDNKEKLDAFFEKAMGYNDTMVSESLKIDTKEVKPLLEWYARLELGIKIRDCVKEKGQCSFTAEL
jgi:hypothetical protein